MISDLAIHRLARRRRAFAVGCLLLVSAVATAIPGQVPPGTESEAPGAANAGTASGRGSEATQSSTSNPSAEDTRREFTAVCEQFRSGHHFYFGTAQVEHLNSVLAGQDLPADARAKGLGQLGRELLRLGQIREAVVTFERGLAIAGEQPSLHKLAQSLRADLGLAYLRLGEVTNCIGHHGPAMCIFPIAKEGQHPEPEAAEKAIVVFTEFLRRGTNPEVRWLLNLAAMVAGRYPDAVPVALRLPPRALRAEDGGLGLFRDVASKSGLVIHDNAGGAVVDDFNGDGLLDVITSSVEPCTPLRFFVATADGSFQAKAEEAGLTGQLGAINMNHTDYDNDGHLDLLLLRGGWLGKSGRIRNSLLRNRGDGTFEDVTAAAGLAEPAYPTQTAAWADYDGDGDLDLYIGNEGVHPDFDPYPSQLFRNEGDGTFSDVAEAAGVRNLRYAKGVAWGDYDGDGDPDLYVSNLGPNRLYRNQGDGTFVDVAPSLGLTEPARRSFPTWFFDLENDGDLDLFVADYSANNTDMSRHLMGETVLGKHPRLYRNLGDGTFEEVSRELGLTAPSLPMGANYGDLDGDGYLDFYLGTGFPFYQGLMPNLLYRNEGGKRLRDLTYGTGFGHLQKGHGIAFADLDNDGDLDVFEQMGGVYPGDTYPSSLYQNPGYGHRYVVLKLVGREANRAAIGARLRLDLGEAGVSRTVFRTVSTGGSFGGSPLRQTIGLGQATELRQLEIRWPGSGTKQTFTDLVLDRAYRIIEGEAQAELLDLPRLRLGTAAHQHHHASSPSHSSQQGEAGGTPDQGPQVAAPGDG